MASALDRSQRNYNNVQHQSNGNSSSNNAARRPRAGVDNAATDLLSDRWDDDGDAEPDREKLNLASFQRLPSRGLEITNGAANGEDADRATQSSKLDEVFAPLGPVGQFRAMENPVGPGSGADPSSAAIEQPREPPEADTALMRMLVMSMEAES